MISMYVPVIDVLRKTYLSETLLSNQVESLNHGHSWPYRFDECLVSIHI